MTTGREEEVMIKTKLKDKFKTIDGYIKEHINEVMTQEQHFL